MKQALICCAIAFVITAAIGPSVIRYLRKMKFGQKILEIGPKWHMNKQNIPTMGGFMFIIGIALAVILGGLITGTLSVHALAILGLKLAEQLDKPIGKYGRMRQRYLKEYRPALYSSLLLSEKLYSHLLEIDEVANARMDILMPQLMKAAGATEELKAADQMKWVGLANNCRAQAEEIVLSELIFD